MKVLVTGVSGFVGSAVARELVRAGWAVRGLVREASERSHLDALPIELVYGDLREPASLRAALDGCEAVFHVAADYRLWARRPEELYASNVEGTRNVLRAAADAGIRRAVYTSSVATLGTLPDRTPADESTPVSIDDMIGPYKRSKFLAEEAARAVMRETGLEVVIVNPSTPLGPGDVKPTPTGKMIADALAGRIPAYVDTGLNIVHVDDVAIGHRLAFERGRAGERYILGGENLSLHEILEHLARIGGHPPPRLRLPHALVLPIAIASEWWARVMRAEQPAIVADGVRMAKKWMFFSSEKARRELGYAPRPARDALEDAVRWFRERGG